MRSRNGAPASDGTVRHGLHALSNLHRTEQQEDGRPPGYNPVQALRSKPKAAAREALVARAGAAARVRLTARTARLTRLLWWSRLRHDPDRS